MSIDHSLRSRARHGGIVPFLFTVFVATIPGCSTKHVTRIEPETVTDLSGRWNDTDSRLVANALIAQSLSGEWIDRYSGTQGGDSPTLIVGTFHNRTSEHIAVNTFVRELELAYVNSGAVGVVASPAEREEIRSEREDQQEFARADSRARLGQELGANFILQGELQSIEDEETTTRFGLRRKEKVVFYQIDARIIDLETNLVVWAGQHEIKKYIERKPLGL
jgi:hypothetical protein